VVNRPIWNQKCFAMVIVTILFLATGGMSGSCLSKNEFPFEDSVMANRLDEINDPEPILISRESDSLRSGAPKYAALIEHRDGGERLAIFDLRTKKMKYVSPEDTEPRAPIWSPNGRYLAYRQENHLLVYAVEQSTNREIFAGLNVQAVRSFAFSPNSHIIAALSLDSVVLVDLTTLDSNKVLPNKVAMSKGCKPIDLLWSPDNNTLLVLCFASHEKVTQLLRISMLTLEVVVGNVEGVNRFLGWQPTSKSPIVVRAKKGREEAGMLKGYVTFVALRPAVQGEFVFAYIPVDSRVIMCASVEDLSDPTTLTAVSLDQQKERPWLRRYPLLSELSISHSGRWALFVDRVALEADGGVGGDIYIVATDDEKAVRLLSANVGEVSYSSPVPWP
jgi:hypothetical protein